ncbi:MAG TPA: VIT domain-containing protein, partial [Abditibacteriaceae bacterium]|nr:VIT domain-containing protein [Abditibacteriaceae bacterium]
MKIRLRKAVISGFVVCQCAALGWADGARADFVLKPSGQNAIPLRRKALQVDATLRGGVASEVQTMTFANETSQRTEADFILTVPPGAVVSGFAYWFGTEKVVARVVEKERAALIYSYITSRMRDPALVEMIGKNTFRARIFPVMPNADLKVEIQTVQPLSSIRNGLLWQLPLKAERAGTGTLDALDVRVKIADEGAVRNVANSFNIVSRREQNARTLLFSRRNYRPDRDLNVSLLQAPRSLSSSVYAARSGGGDGFFVVRLSARETLRRPRVWIQGAIYDLVAAPAHVWRAGQNWIVCGRYKGSGMAQMSVAGKTAKGVTRRWTLPIALNATREDNNAATKLWAWARIAQLSASAKNRAKVVALSTRFTLPSKYTSWLAIPREERERYAREKAQADVEIMRKQAIAAVQHEGASSPRAKRLRARYEQAARAAGHNTKTEWTYQLSQAIAPLQKRLNAENNRSRPRRRTRRALQRQISALERAGGINPYDVEAAYAVEDELIRMQQKLEVETNRGRANGRRARRLKREIARLSNRYERLAAASSLPQRWVGGGGFRSGDPLISVEAPDDTDQVTALLPGGVIKRLLFNAQSRKWEARFDIPTYASE